MNCGYATLRSAAVNTVLSGQWRIKNRRKLGTKLLFIPKLLFRRFRKTAKSNYQLRHFCPSVRVEQLGFHSTDFHKI